MGLYPARSNESNYIPKKKERKEILLYNRWCTVFMFQFVERHIVYHFTDQHGGETMGKCVFSGHFSSGKCSRWCTVFMFQFVERHMRHLG